AGGRVPIIVGIAVDVVGVTIDQADDGGIIDRVGFDQVIFPRSAVGEAIGTGTDRLTAVEPLDDVGHERVIRLKDLERQGHAQLADISGLVAGIDAIGEPADDVAGLGRPRRFVGRVADHGGEIGGIAQAADDGGVGIEEFVGGILPDILSVHEVVGEVIVGAGGIVGAGPIRRVRSLERQWVIVRDKTGIARDKIMIVETPRDDGRFVDLGAGPHVIAIGRVLLPVERQPAGVAIGRAVR